MDHHRQFQSLLEGAEPMLALAPMQDVTTLPFWRLSATYGGGDFYVTEYFRVHSASRLDRDILRCVTQNPTGRPVVAQLIGNDIPGLVRTARELQHHPVAAIDLNLGCPAPVVYRKCAGGGLLREPERIDAILGALRDAVRIKFSVKTRIGFDSATDLERLLPVYARHSLDLLTVHGRLVRQLNQGTVDYEAIRLAVEAVNCPVMANGNVYSAANAKQILKQTGARGLMIGRGAVRNPWLFTQIRQYLGGEQVALPTGRDVLRYVHELCNALRPSDLSERTFVQMMKKYLNFIGEGVEPAGQFLHSMRRAATEADLFRICATFLDHDEPMTLEPPCIGLPG